MPLWKSNLDEFYTTALYKFKTRHCPEAKSYKELHQWSIQHIEAFWNFIWEDLGVIGQKTSSQLGSTDIRSAQWFQGSQLNFAENLLENPRIKIPNQVVIFSAEGHFDRTLTLNQLKHQVALAQKELTSRGLQSGDRVVFLGPNSPRALISLLAASSLGISFASASPDFGIEGLVERFGQITPKLLIAVDSCRYSGSSLSQVSKINELQQKLNLDETHVLKYNYDEEFMGDSLTPSYTRLNFDHPLMILFTSGTTGAPKCMVHGHGGTLLQHLKEHQLQSDIRPGDHLFYFTTTGWMMWNWLVSGLASGASLLMYDGNPMHNGGQALFGFLSQYQVSHLGTSAKFAESMEKMNVIPSGDYNFEKLRMVLSTGSPLSVAGFQFLNNCFKPNTQVCSISGGSDIVSCFLLGNPWNNVTAGEIQGPGLGMNMQVWDEDGNRIYDKKGELVCTSPFPSRPIEFWNDPSGKKYTAAYFEKWPQVWTHGDFAEEKSLSGGWILYGRSDATLNPGGVRIGTSEIYQQLESFPEILEALCTSRPVIGDEEIILFIVLRNGLFLDDALKQKIRRHIREHLSPRHSPKEIFKISSVPRTKSGKIVELAVKNLLAGRKVSNREALANPESLDEIAVVTQLTK